MSRKLNVALAKKYGAVVIPFKNLPVSHQVAIAHYMAIDGEAWEVLGDLEKNFEKIRPKHYADDKRCQKEHEKFQKEIIRLLTLSIAEYVKKYGKAEFGVCEIPTPICIDLCKKRSPDFEDTYSAFNGKPPDHPLTNRFPCILSSFNDELFEDGWHRFYCYRERKDKTIPCIYFA